MFTLKKIGPLSVAKIYALLFFIIGVSENVIAFLIVSLLYHNGGLGTLLHVASIPLIFLLAFVAIILMFIVFGFLVGLIGSWLYNLIANLIGGVKIDLKADKLRGIDPMSYAKVLAAFGLIFGIIIGLVLAAFGGTILHYLGMPSVPGLALGFTLFIAAIIVGIVGGFVLGLVTTLIYNYLARHVGPIILHFQGRELRHIGALSYAKISGIGGLIFGFIYGVLSMSVSGFLINLIGLPILAFLISGAIAIIYNWLVKRIGGYRITLHEYQHTAHHNRA